MISSSRLVFKTLVVTRGAYFFGESMLKLRRQKEAQLAQKIKKGLEASFVSVTDTTIGTSSCGEMYNIVVESPIFEGKSKLQQQRLVNEVLSEQIKNIHGFSLKTRTPRKVEPSPDKKGPDKLSNASEISSHDQTKNKQKQDNQSSKKE